jgi:hypothetical protein
VYHELEQCAEQNEILGNDIQGNQEITSREIKLSEVLKRQVTYYTGKFEF